MLFGNEFEHANAPLYMRTLLECMGRTKLVSVCESVRFVSERGGTSMCMQNPFPFSVASCLLQFREFIYAFMLLFFSSSRLFVCLFMRSLVRSICHFAATIVVVSHLLSSSLFNIWLIFAPILISATISYNIKSTVVLQLLAAVLLKNWANVLIYHPLPQALCRCFFPHFISE